MKVIKFVKTSGLAIAGMLIFAVNLSAQTENPPVNVDKQTETKPPVTETPKTELKPVTAETPTTETKTDVTVDEAKTQTPPAAENKTEPSASIDDKTVKKDGDDGAEDILPYYTNYLKEYRLGPSDIISIEVFGQCPDYCKTGLTVPPTARISYPLIREGVMVGGRTVEEVAAEVTKKLDEYIIDPKVTVTLDKAMSVRYSVMGKVAQPGIRIMDRKVSVYEAVIEAGGVTKDGNKKKIALIRFNREGTLQRQDINLAEMETGKTPMIYLEPGDQVFVSGKGFTIDKAFDYLGKVSVVRLLFGSPF